MAKIERVGIRIIRIIRLTIQSRGHRWLITWTVLYPYLNVSNILSYQNPVSILPYSYSDYRDTSRGRSKADSPCVGIDLPARGRRPWISRIVRIDIGYASISLRIATRTSKIKYQTVTIRIGDPRIYAELGSTTGNSRRREVKLRGGVTRRQSVI
ncbi:MAG: hypothetical protein QW815_08125 [Nitrososphaerota archaeon]